MARFIFSSAVMAVLFSLLMATVAFAQESDMLVMAPAPSPLAGSAGELPASAAVLCCSLLFSLVAPHLLR